MHLCSKEISSITTFIAEAVTCSRGKEKGGAVASFAWHDVRCSYVDKRGEEKEVLHGVSGCMDGGHMLAVIGTP